MGFTKASRPQHWMRVRAVRTHQGEPDEARPPGGERRSPSAPDRGTSERPLSASEASAGRHVTRCRHG